MKARTGLFGGSFDPVHNGHLAIAESFLRSDLVDELWVLLTPSSPHKEDQQLADFSLRLKMLDSAFEAWEQIHISTIEEELPKPSYTIQTIQHLQHAEPDRSFIYCLGEDSLREFHTWRSYQNILDHCELLVAQRPGVSHNDVEPAILDKTHFVDHDPVQISSTDIKDRISKGLKVDHLLPDSVLKIIEKEQLYK